MYRRLLLPLLRSCRSLHSQRSIQTQLLVRGVSTSAVKLSDGSPVPMEHLKENPYLAKYAAKMKHLQEDDPEEYQSKLDELDRQKKKEKVDKLKAIEDQKAKLREEALQSKPKLLESIMKLELIEDRSAPEIEEIWKEYHRHKNCIYATIPAAEYKDMYARLRQFPTFLYPIPRNVGYDFFIQQFSGHECQFTPLTQFQAHKEDAPVCLTVTHYTDIMEDKGIVLMRGEPDTAVLSINEATLLALQTKMYYGVNCGLKFNLVRLFNNDPASFRHMDLVKEFENYKKDTRDKQTGEYGFGDKPT